MAYTSNLRDSEQKRRQRKYIYEEFKNFIDINKDTVIATVMMPANNGILENQLLQILPEKAGLFTFDRVIGKKETGIESHPRWVHQKNDVFEGTQEVLDNTLVFAWFDLCGGFTNQTLEGLISCVGKMRKGSFFALTVAVTHIRGMCSRDVIKKDSLWGDPFMNSALINGMISAEAQTMGKSLELQTPMIYQRNKTVFMFQPIYVK